MMKPPIKPGDVHVYVDGKHNVEKVYDSNGKLLHTFQVFPHGINGPNQAVRGGDTVENLYKLGKPRWTQPNEDEANDKRPYGWVFIPMLDVEGKQTAVGRAGFGAHGGGEWGDYWAPKQKLTYTMGCVRHHNEDAKTLAQLVEKTHQSGHTVWMSVDQPGGGGQV